MKIPKAIKRVISTPNLTIVTSILLYGFVAGKVNGIIALSVIGTLFIFALLGIGNKELWK